jgi:hypothetical protein
LSINIATPERPAVCRHGHQFRGLGRVYGSPESQARGVVLEACGVNELKRDRPTGAEESVGSSALALQAHLKCLAKPHDAP